MKRTVFLTGATGRMGGEGFKQLLDRRDRFDIVVLVLPSERAKMARFEHESGFKVVWGDLTNYADVLRGVTGADYVLHVGGMVSPHADYHPDLTTRVNIGSIQNIIRAIQAQPNPDAVKLVYIGTVAQTGDRNPPIHWGRTGDPIKISLYDNYALTKTIAERAVVESGLKYWVSLRQTGILHANMLNGLDPIMYHNPINGVFEWVTVRDSGRLLANVCEEDVPEAFWRRIYNIGGGEQCRLTNHEFMALVLGTLGIKDFRDLYEPNWFATRNFHGQWYEDSGLLEQYLHFRREGVADFLADLKRNKPSYMNIVPPFIMKQVMGRSAKQPHGPLHWINQNIESRITAFFGSRSEWEQLPGWDRFELLQPSKVPVRLDHGYDESKPALELADMRQAARFRGGECVSPSMTAGDLRTKLQWRCAFGHAFDASPTLVLLAGHWCPDCLAHPWNYDEEAKRNPFFAQVWYPLT